MILKRPLTFATPSVVNDTPEARAKVQRDYKEIVRDAVRYFGAERVTALNKEVAIARRLLALLIQFQESAEFQFKISPRTRRDYIKQIKRIEKAFGDFPIKALDDPRATSIFLEWRDRLAQSSLRQADYAYATLSRILSWALGRRKIKTNPCASGGKLYAGTRVDKIWSDADVDRFLRTAPAYLQLAMLLAINTGQRQGDLLRLPWSAYDGTSIKMKQRKTGAFRSWFPMH